MKIQLKNFHAVWSAYSDVSSICGETDSQHYHIWVNNHTLLPQDNILHRNPCKAGEGTYQALSQSAKCNHHIVAQLRRAASSAIAAAKLEFEKQQAKQRAEWQERKRQEKIKDAGPKLLEALKQLRSFFDDAGVFHIGEDHRTKLAAALKNVDMAITEAEGK